MGCETRGKKTSFVPNFPETGWPNFEPRFLFSLPPSGCGLNSAALIYNGNLWCFFFLFVMFFSGFFSMILITVQPKTFKAYMNMEFQFHTGGKKIRKWQPSCTTGQSLFSLPPSPSIPLLSLTPPPPWSPPRYSALFWELLSGCNMRYTWWGINPKCQHSHGDKSSRKYCTRGNSTP